MRIAQIVEATNGGVARHVMDLSGGLLDLGHEVHILYGTGRMDGIFESRLSDLVDRGAKAQPIKMPWQPSWGDLAAIRDIRQYLKANGPFEVVHGHSSKGGAYARISGKGHGRIFYTPHAFITMGANATSPKLRLFAAAERALARRTDAIICVSEFERQHALSIGLPDNRLCVVHNGVGTPSATPRSVLRARWGISEDTYVVGFVGRMSPQKNPLRALRTFATADLPSNSALLMIGEGELLASAQSFAQELQISNRVKWLGRQDGHEAMNGFDVFLLTSDYEGYPYVILEAQMASLPIVALESGAIAEAAPGATVVTNEAELAKRLSDVNTNRPTAPVGTVQEMTSRTIDHYLRIGAPN